MESNKRKGLSSLGVILVIILGIVIGKNMFQSGNSEMASSSATPSSVKENTSKPPLFTSASIKEQMTQGFSQTTWFKYIDSYILTNSTNTIRIRLNVGKKSITSDKAKIIAGAVAGLTYLHGQTNYLIYEVVDNKSNILYRRDIVDENSKNMMNSLKQVIEQSKGIIQKLEPRDKNWSGMNIVVSDAWYDAKDFEKERFVAAYGNEVKSIILKYMNVIGKEDIDIYFVDSFGTVVAGPKMFGGYKIEK